MTFIVFSKDRALQLDAFLRSYELHVTPTFPMHVLFLATSTAHAIAYDEVFRRHACATPHVQDVFALNLFHILPTDGLVTFFVDDQVFIRSWDVIHTLPAHTILSLRLGLNLTRNYASGDTKQELPPLQSQERFFTWKWYEGEIAWRYPLSVDGHVFNMCEIRPLIEQCHFHSPNTLESSMNSWTFKYLNWHGLCYAKSCIVNIPWNTVQTDWVNRHEGGSAEDFLQMWNKGYQIDIGPYHDVDNKSVHQPFALSLEPRH